MYPSGAHSLIKRTEDLASSRYLKTKGFRKTKNGKEVFD
jgi:hypothetical protein